MKKRIWKIRWQISQKVFLWCLSFVITMSFSLGFLPFRNIEIDTDNSNKITKFIEKAKADHLGSVNVEAPTLVTTTSTTIYTTMLNAVSGDFVGGRKYFIYFHMGLGHSSTSGRVDYQVKYGAAVQYTGTVEPAYASNNAVQVSWIDVYTQPSTAVAVTVSFKCDTAGTAGALNAHLIALDLDEKMIEDYDYYYNENTSSGAHGTTFTSKASITLNNADGLKDWLIFAMEDLQIDTTSVSAQARIWDGSSGYLSRLVEGEDSAERYTFALIASMDNVARGTTYSIQVSDDAGGQNDHIKSRIFAFDLNVFNSHGTLWGSSSVALGSAFTQIDTLAYQPAVAGNHVVFASYLDDVATIGTRSNDRLQFGGTTKPTGWSWAQLGTGKTNHDATDKTVNNISAVVYQTASSRNIDLDVQEIVGTSQVAYDRSITVFSTLYNHMPQIKNWRWYADEEDVTPGTAYAAENTVPPQAEMGKNIAMKLRINIDEVGGQYENNNRKKIYYATGSTGPWTEVGSISDISGAWHYYDGGGTDNVLVNASTLLTGTTARGIHNESNSAGPDKSNHAAGAVVEHEFSLENYNATANTTYYFAFFDEDVGLIPPASGSSLPYLTTASAYDLSVVTPPAVDFGECGIGNPCEYHFTGGEEITIRDNRGKTLGNSSGWSLAADISTELYFQQSSGYCGDVTFTGSGLDDMSIFFCANTLAAETDYKVVILFIQGGGMPDLFEWYRNGELTGMGECGPGVFLEENIFVSFTQIDGHTVTDYWEFTAYPTVNVTITKDNMYWITNAISGLYDAPTTGISGNPGEYMSSAVTAASVSGSAKQGLGGFEFLPTMEIYNFVSSGNYTGVITFTIT